MLQAIITKYIGPTDTKGSRVKALASAGSVTRDWDDALSHRDNHIAAAKALAAKLDWAGEWHGGALPDGKGYCFVQGDIGQGPLFVTYSRHDKEREEDAAEAYRQARIRMAEAFRNKLTEVQK